MDTAQHRGQGQVVAGEQEHPLAQAFGHLLRRIDHLLAVVRLDVAVGAAAFRELVRRVDEGAPAAGGDELAAVLLLVAAVIVAAALEEDRDATAGGPDHLPFEVPDVAVRAHLGALGPAVDLLGHAEDDAVALLHGVAGDIGEVADLGLVDEVAELQVDAPEPPAVGEGDGEIASRLARPQGPQLPPPAEDVGEVDEAVVPVVAAGDDEQVVLLGPWPTVARSVRHRRPVGAQEPVLVLGALGDGVHLVAAHHQDPPAMGRLTVELQLGLGQQVGDGVGRVEPVAQVGDVVDPHLGRLGPVVDVRRHHRLQFPVVGVGAPEARRQHPPGRVEELVGVEPSHHGPADEVEVGFRRRPSQGAVGAEFDRTSRGSFLGHGHAFLTLPRGSSDDVTRPGQTSPLRPVPDRR